MGKSVGKHFVVEFKDCDPERIKYRPNVEAALLDAVQASGATYINHYVHQFEPFGVSAVVLIAESHFSLHTWPEERYAGFDVFTCGPRAMAEKAITLLRKAFAAREVEQTVMERQT